MTMKHSLDAWASLSRPPFYLGHFAFLNPFFFFFPCVIFLWGVDFVSTSGVCLTLKRNQRKKKNKGNMSDLHETSALTQDLILKHFVPSFFVLVITCYCLIRSVLCYLVPTLIMFFVVPGYKSLVPYVFMCSCVTCMSLHAGVSSQFFFYLSSSLFCFFQLPGITCAVECSSCVFPPCLPLFSLLCRGCAVPDGWGPQTDPSAARGDGWYSELKGFLAVRHSTLCKNSAGRSPNRILAYFSLSFFHK